MANGACEGVFDFAARPGDQVVAGLKKHVEREALLGSHAVAILNLKPVRLAGEASEAMMLAADAPLEASGELVRLLSPPGEPWPSAMPLGHGQQ